ncbi:MAG: 30S ribosomal protein S1 [Candidatus Nealsonbacteria bacterium]|nr:MAG: 30S ribosomal protein S1 [Candidatus Nealsonbacteria bacterium]
MKNAAEIKNNDLPKPPKVGEIVEGKIIGTGKSTIYVDLGNKGTGIIYGREFYTAKNELKNLKVGDKVFAKIVDLETDDGYIELSLTEAGKELSWEKLNEKKEKDAIINVKILGANKGGLITEVEGLQGFLPVSQLAPEHYPRVEGADKTKILNRLQKLVGKELEVKILDLNPKKEILIFSERATEIKKIKEILKKYKVGDIVEGEITGIVDFGAFVKFGKEELEGLIHISELDWQLIEDPADIVQVGDKIKAKIIEITEDGRVSLSLKALKKDPWENLKEKYKKEDTVEGKVTKFNPFGAFVEIEPKIQGLAHISEFGTRSKMEEKLKIGETYKFKILQIEPKEHKMTLTLIER